MRTTSIRSSRQQDTTDGRTPEPPRQHGWQWRPGRACRLPRWLLPLGLLAWVVTAQAAGPRLAYFYKPPLDGTTAGFLAHHYDLIILTHADEAYRDQLRRAGYTGMILQNLAANEAEGPGPYANHQAHCDDSYQPYQRTAVDEPGMFCHEVHRHEGWFLHNRNGQRLYAHTRSANGVWRTTYAMNPGSRGWQQFLIGRLRAYRRLGYDGFFLDNVALSRYGLLHEPVNHGGLQEYATDEDFRRAELSYLAALRHAFPEVPLWANLVHDPGTPGNWMPYLHDLNGMMVEDFATGWKDYPLPSGELGQQLQNIQQALAAGKDVIAVAQGLRDDQQRLEMALACYWLLDNGHLYFRYADAFDWAYRKVWWYRQYQFDPGIPLTPLRASATQWSRRYPSGVILVDFSTRRANLPRAAGFSSQPDAPVDAHPAMP